MRRNATPNHTNHRSDSPLRLEVETRVLGGEVSMEGPVRITMPTYLAAEFVHEIRDFARTYPAIELEIIASDELNNISKREADIAVRVAYKSKIPDHLVGRKFSKFSVAIFGVAAFKHLPPDDRPWVGSINSFAEPSAISGIRQRHGNGPWALKTDNNFALVEAVRAGIGVTPMACGCPHLTRGLVAITEPEDYGDIWVLTHPELRRSPRIRAALDFWYGVMEQRGPAFAGGL